MSTKPFECTICGVKPCSHASDLIQTLSDEIDALLGEQEAHRDVCADLIDALMDPDATKDRKLRAVGSALKAFDAEVEGVT